MNTYKAEALREKLLELIKLSRDQQPSVNILVKSLNGRFDNLRILPDSCEVRDDELTVAFHSDSSESCHRYYCRRFVDDDVSYEISEMTVLK
ncbi:MAG: hypothetical protein JWO73_824 [Candidatus Taylorbacteria bacterium]|nr:hypothetical protein [Candidatus Taylorbacteria bacterium]